jgi:hypothetical protein
VSLDDKLYGWDAALRCCIRQLEAYKARQDCARTVPHSVVSGWDDAISIARKLIGDARTQKGFVARECAEIEKEEPRP